MHAQVRIREMLNYRFDVIRHPSVKTFRFYSARASDSDALTYVAVMAFIIALISAFMGGVGSAMNLLLAMINTLFNFYLFAGVVYFVGKQFGGGGEFESVVYTFSLFHVPILLLTWLLQLVAIYVIPDINVFLYIGLLGTAAQAFYAYLAAQSCLCFSRRLDALLSVGAGILVFWVIQQIFRTITS
ncbi:MAG: hypothetical protein GFH27_549279n514 [Chloroflexi bacterium AL-W]|nr:hypothetical protein [Chloroflexi bacterium AL-N1]NOK65479.1 hypothetical protein [Chloroflexi bacterium AL-N10]NOK72255.1 hypothetical protein [Chloroflexi bacterium AL-N5]NOK79659.1 hypothetical protein [Chloroflexi bacterium AL-W]NOK87574.1 hypothetical protein [Chloroflexi bacterium AL-N15]